MAHVASATSRPDAAAPAANSVNVQEASNNNSSMIKTAITVALVAAVAIGVTAAFVFAAPIVGIICVAVAGPLTLLFLAGVWAPRSDHVVYTTSRNYEPIHVVDTSTPVFVHHHSRPFYVPTPPVVVHHRPVMPRTVHVPEGPVFVPTSAFGGSLHSSHSGMRSMSSMGPAHVRVGGGHFGVRR